MRRIVVVMALAFGVLLAGITLTSGSAAASAPAQEGPTKVVMFESFTRGA